ncbi:MAG: glycine--tRNA ligase subunit beta, partial [Terriglobales bacterium]
MPDFLLEIGCEEIPARMLDSGAAELGRRVAELLVAERLADKAEVEIFSTPRRLAVLAQNIRASQPDLEEQLLGPSTKVAFKDGKPTPAANAFAKKVGLDPSKLEKITTPKGEYLAAHVTRKGRAAGEVLAEKLPAEVLRIYWPKTMYWRGKAA